MKINLKENGKISIDNKNYICEDYEIRQILSAGFIEISKTKTDLFVYEIETEKYTEKTPVDYIPQEGEEMEEQFEEIEKTREIKGVKVYLKVNEEEKTRIEKEKGLEEINKNFKNQVKEKIYSKTINGIKTYYTDEEIKTWDTKVAEAKKVIAGEESLALAGVKPEGITLQDFAGKVLQKAHDKFIIYAQLEQEKNLKIKQLFSN